MRYLSQGIIVWLSCLLLLVACASPPSQTSDKKQRRNSSQVQNLIELLGDSDKSVRLEAIKTLGELRDFRAITALSKNLTAKSWVEREAVVITLSKMNDYFVIPPLFTVINDDDKFVKESAEKALHDVVSRLGTKRDPRMIKHLAQQLSHSRFRNRKLASELLHLAVYSLRSVKVTEYLKYLKTSLESESRYSRRLTAVILQDVKHPSVFAMLLNTLTDHIKDVREAAADSLQILGEPENIETIVEAIQHQNEFVRKQAGLLLHKYRKKGYQQQVIALLKHKSEFVRASALATIKEWGPNLTLQTHIEPLLNDAYAEVRFVAADTLSSMGWTSKSDEQAAVFCIAQQDWERCITLGEAIIKPLVVASRDRDPDIRKEAGEALVAINWQPSETQEQSQLCVIKMVWDTCVTLGSVAVDPLINELSNNDVDIRINVIETLGAIGDKKAIPPLVHYLNDTDQDVRLAIVNNLAKFKSKSVIVPLIKALDDASRSIRMAAVDSLAANIGVIKKTKDIRIVQPIVTALKDNNRHVRKVAADILGEIRNVQIVPHLIAALKDQDAAVRTAASNALQKIKGPATIDAFIQSLDNDNDEIRRQAVIVLGDVKDDKTLDRLKPMLSDKSIEVRLATIGAISNFKSTTASTILISALEDIEVPVRLAATEKLGEYDTVLVTAALLKSSNDVDIKVRTAARKQLIKIKWRPATESQKTTYCIIHRQWNTCLTAGIDALRPLLKELSFPDAPDKAEIVKVLGKLGNPQAIDAILNTIKESQWSENNDEKRKTIRYAQRALNQIGKQGLAKLEPYLYDWYMGKYIVNTLTQFGWHTNSEDDLIRFFVAKRDETMLLSRWPLTKKVLLQDIVSGHYGLMTNALNAFIGLGRKEIIDDLVDILNSQGTIQVAEVFLNSENEQLIVAAKTWVADNGHFLRPYGRGNNPVLWGKFR